jgi:F420-dependent oxidoreductase-like protein
VRLELMIEGQEGVTWEEWVGLARACEQHGVGTLFRSDHYLSVMGHEDRGSLETWTTLAGLAAITTRLRFGVLVSPATFRHPSVLAKVVAAVDQISGGRVDFGLGAGWNEREHEAYGFEFPPLGARLELVEEQLEIACGAWADGPFSFTGAHYTIEALDALPKPVQRPHPPIIIGGGAKPRTARIAARFADEYNTVYATPAECAERRAVCEAAWTEAGRDPGRLTFSVMLPWVDGTDAELMAVVGESAAVGIPRAFDDAVARLRSYRDAGVDRVMLQHLRHRDVEAIAEIPRLTAALA